MGMPKEEDGRWNLPECLAWRIARIREQHENRVNEGGKKRQLDERKAELEIEKRELALRKEDGTLIDRAEAEAKIIRQHLELKVRLENLPGELAASIEPARRAQFIRDSEQRIRLMLRGLARERGLAMRRLNQICNEVIEDGDPSLLARFLELSELAPGVDKLILKKTDGKTMARAFALLFRDGDTKLFEDAFAALRREQKTKPRSNGKK